MLWPALALRWLLGGWLLYLAWPKLVQPGPFAAQLGNFQLLSPVVVGWAAAILPMVGFVLGAALVTGVARRGAAAATALLALVAVVALIQARIRGLDLGCGCYSGVVSALSPERALVMSGLALVGSLLLLLEPYESAGQRALIATLGIALSMLNTEAVQAATPDTEVGRLWRQLGEGVRATDLVVEGRLAYRRTFRADGIIFTEHYFEVLNTFKGDALDTVSCVLPGGKIGEDGMLLVGSPRPVIEGTYLLMLREHRGSLRLWQLDRGIISVAKLQRLLGQAWRTQLRDIEPRATTPAPAASSRPAAALRTQPGVHQLRLLAADARRGDRA